MNPMVRNVAVYFLTQILSWAMTFVVTLYLPRYVGDKGLGVLTFAGSVTTIFGVVASLGLSGVLVKEIARNRDATGSLVRSALLLRVPFATLMMGLAVVFTWAVGCPLSTCVIVAISGAVLILYNANDVLSTALQGREELVHQSRTSLIDKFSGSVLMITLIFLGAPLWVLVAGGIVTATLSLGINSKTLYSLVSPEPKIHHEDLWQLVRRGLPFLGVSAFQTLYGQTDPIVLRLLANDATVGWYAAGMRFIGTSFVIPTALSFALLPTLNRLFSTDPERFRSLSNRMLSLLLLCGVPVSLVLVCIPDSLFSLLHYPASFANSIPVMRIGGVGVLFWFAAFAVGTVVIASDGQARMCRAAIAATVFGGVLCVITSWIGHRWFGNGAAGATLSDVLVEICLLVAYVRMLPAGFFSLHNLTILFRCSLAAVPMLALLVGAKNWNWGIAIVLPATAVYALGCLLLRCIDREYIHLIRSLISRRRVPE